MLREIIRADTLPDYVLVEEPGDIINVSPRSVVVDAADAPTLKPETLDAARALVPGSDIYALEARWRAFWAASGRPKLRSADKAFLGWVEKTGG